MGDAAAAEPMVHCENLVKIYKVADLEVVALQGLDLEVPVGEVLAVVGNSGSGKSTLLNILGGLDRPSAGRVVVGGAELLKLREADLVVYRRDTVGFVWQSNARNLVPWLSAEENVELPMLVSARPAAARRERARMLLDLVGLSHRRASRTVQLSGGEQQRVAIAIGLANSPKLLLADEPTGELDTETAARLLEVFREANRATGVTIIIVTHDPRLSAKVDRVVAMRDGRTSTELVRRRSYRDEMADAGTGLGDPRHEELAIVDRTGRLQLPREYLDAAGIRGQARVELDGARIVVRPPEDHPPGEDPPDAEGSGAAG